VQERLFKKNSTGAPGNSEHIENLLKTCSKLRRTCKIGFNLHHKKYHLFCDIGIKLFVHNTFNGLSQRDCSKISHFVLERREFKVQSELCINIIEVTGHFEAYSILL
jgi:hypothetical protein